MRFPGSIRRLSLKLAFIIYLQTTNILGSLAKATVLNEGKWFKKDKENYPQLSQLYPSRGFTFKNDCIRHMCTQIVAENPLVIDSHDPVNVPFWDGMTIKSFQ